MHVAVYARNSLDQEVSPVEDQLHMCELWAQKNGYTIIGKFLDETIVDQDVTQRPGLSRLIETVADNNVLLIVMEHASVISENQNYLDDFYTKMDVLNVTIETLKTHSFTPLAAQFSDANKRKLKLKRYADKKRSRVVADATKGRLPGGKIFGYDVQDNGVRIPNATEAETVRYIFDTYLKMRSINKLCDDLNANKIPAPKGEKWTKSSLLGTRERQSGLLRQSLYGGIFTFNKMAFKTHPKTGKRFSVTRPEEEWDRVPIPELAIVDEPLFVDVQNLIKSKNRTLRYFKALPEERNSLGKENSNKNTRKSARRKHIVGSNLFCGKCKEPLKTIRAGRYSCRNEECKNFNLFRDSFVPKILEVLSEITFEDMRSGVKELQEQEKALIMERQSLIGSLSEKLSVVRNIEEQENREQLQFEYSQAKVRLTEVDVTLKNLNLAEHTPDHLEIIYRGFMADVQNCLADPESSEEVEKIRYCIECVEVTKTGGGYDVHVLLSFPGILVKYPISN